MASSSAAPTSKPINIPPSTRPYMLVYPNPSMDPAKQSDPNATTVLLNDAAIGKVTAKAVPSDIASLFSGQYAGWKGLLFWMIDVQNTSYFGPNGWSVPFAILSGSPGKQLALTAPATVTNAAANSILGSMYGVSVQQIDTKNNPQKATLQQLWCVRQWTTNTFIIGLASNIQNSNSFLQLSGTNQQDVSVGILSQDFMLVPLDMLVCAPGLSNSSSSSSSQIGMCGGTITSASSCIQTDDSGVGLCPRMISSLNGINTNFADNISSSNVYQIQSAAASFLPTGQRKSTMPNIKTSPPSTEKRRHKLKRFRTDMMTGAMGGMGMSINNTAMSSALLLQQQEQQNTLANNVKKNNKSKEQEQTTTDSTQTTTGKSSGDERDWLITGLGAGALLFILAGFVVITQVTAEADPLTE